MIILVVLIIVFYLQVPVYPGYQRKVSTFKHLDQNYYVKQFDEVPVKDLSDYNEIDSHKCETVHVGIVCAGHKSNLQLHTMLKTIYFHSVNPLHFHIIASKNSIQVLSTLFFTWNIERVNATFYDINEYVSDIRWIPNSHYSGVFGLLKLLFPKIVPLTVTNKLIVLDTDLTFLSDIYELWKLFENFNLKQAIGIIENQSDYYLGKNSKSLPWPAIGRGYNSGLVLYHLERLTLWDWSNLWLEITKRTASEYGTTRLGDQDIINAVIKENSNIVYEVPCYWNTQLSDHTDSYTCYHSHKAKVIHWNSPKKVNVVNKDGDYFRSLYTNFLELNGNLLRAQLTNCFHTSKDTTKSNTDVCSEFHRIEKTKWRTLLYFREYKYTVLDSDVTFVAQLSYDRLQMVEELVKYWDGPTSLTFYVTDPEFQLTNNFIETSEVLQDRLNIAYHAVFKDGEYYPINLLRNVGLHNVETPYVFLADIDFLPMRGLYGVLRNQIQTMNNLKNQALVVPAFETQRYRSKIPRSKKQLLRMLEMKTVLPFRQDVWVAGHSPTNYSKWKTANTVYQVQWQPDFEPYIVVRSDVIEYDVTFMGFGWNKVSHVMELEAQSYQFLVLPDAFIIHKAHAPSYDIAKFRTSPIYRMCLQNLKEKFIKKLNKKYGRTFSSGGSADIVTNDLAKAK